MNSRILLAIDLSYQTYRAAAAHPLLTSLEGEFTGGLYGFMVTLAKIIRDTGATDVVICEDRKPYLRSQIYPAYKQLRKKNADDELLERFNASLPLVLEFCDVVGLPTLGVQGFESDDIVGGLVHLYRHRFGLIYAASSDSDLYQLFDVTPRFRVYRKDMEDMMNGQLLLQRTGLTPSQYMLALALQGTHNDIEGIAGVGEKTARKIVLDPAKLRSYQSTHKDLIQRNLALIRLPHADLPRLPLPRPTRTFDARVLYRWCARFDINATASMVTALEGVCVGK